MSRQSLKLFLHKRRIALGLTHKILGQRIGRSMWTSYRIEAYGQLPKNALVLQKFVEVLQTTSAELNKVFEEADETTRDPGQNLLPFIRAIAQGNFQVVVWKDIEFLCDIQRMFEDPLSPELVEALLKQRTGTN
jgi:hypothetical protein